LEFAQLYSLLRGRAVSYFGRLLGVARNVAGNNGFVIRAIAGRHRKRATRLIIVQLTSGFEALILYLSGLGS